jgi:isochorismate synthase EntC
VVASSPEILVRLRDGTVTIRPIAGTRRRGATPEEDRALADDLLNDSRAQRRWPGIGNRQRQGDRAHDGRVL